MSCSAHKSVISRPTPHQGPWFTMINCVPWPTRIYSPPARWWNRGQVCDQGGHKFNCLLKTILPRCSSPGNVHLVTSRRSVYHVAWQGAEERLIIPLYSPLQLLVSGRVTSLSLAQPGGGGAGINPREYFLVPLGGHCFPNQSENLGSNTGGLLRVPKCFLKSLSVCWGGGWVGFCWTSHLKHTTFLINIITVSFYIS